MFKLLTHLKGSVEGFSEAGLNLDDVLSSPYSYAQRFVKTIGSDRQTRDAFSITDVLEVDESCVVKIEGYEKHSRSFYDACTQVARLMNHMGPVTCHLFKSPKGACSFPEHTDPDVVIIHLLTGTKLFHNATGTAITLEAGDFMMIPANYRHEALNLSDNLMLSIGLESFNTEKL